MHVNVKDQLVTSSNLKNINLEFINRGTHIEDGGKIYSKRIMGNLSSVDSPLVPVSKLINNVTEFTLAFWLFTSDSWTEFLNGYISLSVDAPTKKITGRINYGDYLNLTSFDDGGDPWKHIAVVSHNEKITFYVNGIRQIDVAYQEYHRSEYNQVWYDGRSYVDDTCLILNQAVWTDNFAPPEEPLLGDLKYKTALYPKNTIIEDPGYLMVKLY